MDAIDLHVTVGANHHKARLPEGARKMQQQIERIPVRIVKVFEHQQQRLVDRGPPQEAGDGLQQAPAIVRRITVRCALVSGEPVTTMVVTGPGATG